MLGIKKLRKYNSRVYDISNTYDFEEFYGIMAVIIFMVYVLYHQIKKEVSPTWALPFS